MVGEQDRKRKGREAEEWEYQSEVSELTQPFSIFLYFYSVFKVADSLYSVCGWIWLCHVFGDKFDSTFLNKLLLDPLSRK
jgi:hypothetical protein